MASEQVARLRGEGIDITHVERRDDALVGFEVSPLVLSGGFVRPPRRPVYAKGLSPAEPRPCPCMTYDCNACDGIGFTYV